MSRKFLLVVHWLGDTKGIPAELALPLQCRFSLACRRWWANISTTPCTISTASTAFAPSVPISPSVYSVSPALPLFALVLGPRDGGEDA